MSHSVLMRALQVRCDGAPMARLDVSASAQNGNAPLRVLGNDAAQAVRHEGATLHKLCVERVNAPKRVTLLRRVNILPNVAKLLQVDVLAGGQGLIHWLALGEAVVEAAVGADAGVHEERNPSVPQFFLQPSQARPSSVADGVDAAGLSLVCLLLPREVSLRPQLHGGPRVELVFVAGAFLAALAGGRARRRRLLLPGAPLFSRHVAHATLFPPV
eukprot:TRINITY_DN3182_c0_g1_i4.p3 TRINITY_DN3182_c0_g1~~TRINITY_DN3182_c0_g1_i4.p3  ORF type:complete len:215 (+),score=-9.36 TRINITY_DN3182_c0_g1_i4:700-1344(+)